MKLLNFVAGGEATALQDGDRIVFDTITKSFRVLRHDGSRLGWQFEELSEPLSEVPAQEMLGFSDLGVAISYAGALAVGGGRKIVLEDEGPPEWIGRIVTNV